MYWGFLIIDFSNILSKEVALDLTASVRDRAKALHSAQTSLIPNTLLEEGRKHQP